MPNSPRGQSSGLCEGGRGALLATRWRSGNRGLRDKNEARAEQFTGLRELGGDASGVEDGRVLVGVLASGPVGREAVFVDDVEEVAHPAGLGRSVGGLQ